MRAAFLILVFANILLYAWSQGHFGSQDAGREAERLARQLVPEKLHILPAPPVGETPATREAQATRVPPLACKRIEWLVPAEATELQKNLAAVPGWEVGLQPHKEAPQYRVLIPDLPNLATAQKKQGELRKLSVNEGEVAEDAPGGNLSLILKTFASQQAAEEFLQAIGRKGVRSARITTHEAIDKYALQVRAPATDLEKKLSGLLALLPAATLSDCLPP